MSLHYSYGKDSTSRGGLVAFLGMTLPLLVPTGTQLSLVAPCGYLYVVKATSLTMALTGQLNQVRVTSEPQTLNELGICLYQHVKSAPADWAEEINRSNGQEGSSAVLW